MYPGGHMIWMAIGWLFAIAVGAAMVWSLLMVLSSWMKGATPTRLSTEESLQRQLAEGEIDVEEYDRKMEELSKEKQAA